MPVSLPGSNSQIDTRRKHLFIDGAAFQYSIQEITKHIFGVSKTINWNKLSKPYDRVFFYDALPSRNANEDEESYETKHTEKRRFHDSLQILDKYHVREGISKHRRRKGTEQKGVDILLAIEALQQAHTGSADEFTFLLSDLDFYPLLDALVQTRIKTILVFDPRKTSESLIYCADSSKKLMGVDVIKLIDYDDPKLLQKYTPTARRISASKLACYPNRTIEAEGISINVYFDSDEKMYMGDTGSDEIVICSKSAYLLLENLEQKFNLKDFALSEKIELISQI